MSTPAEDYLKSLPWHILITSLSLSIALFFFAAYLCNMGGGWMIIGITLGIPSFISILCWSKRIIGILYTLNYLKNTLGSTCSDSDRNF
ncbi:MAG: hypothetical protein Q8R83_08625 [Legionellaceae bacterium]|nr:hypothetical protein [Legionellaceae bacterium]